MKFTILFISIFILSFTGCGNSHEPPSPEEKVHAYIGDIKLDRILKVDPAEMLLVNEYYTEGKVAYTSERAGLTDRLYVMTRGSDAIEVLKSEDLEFIKKIPLQHHPRSSAYNEVLNLQLVSGKNKPMMSVIDVATDQVVSVVGENKESNVTNNYGGSNATGHPFWVSEDKFALIDREHRLILLYKIEKINNTWTTTKLSQLHTPTSVHHFIGKGNDSMNGGIAMGDQPKTLFHAVAEGSREEFISPQLLEIKLQDDALIITRTTPLLYDPNMGGHHATYHPNGKYIYFPSAEGRLYIIDRESMLVVKTIKTGKGSAHVTFVPKRDIAIVINHVDTFVTIVDSKTNTKIKDVNVSGPAIGNAKLQGHTSFTDKAQNFFYGLATDNGYIYELDLSTYKVSRKLNTGGNPVQGDVF